MDTKVFVFMISNKNIFNVIVLFFQLRKVKFEVVYKPILLHYRGKRFQHPKYVVEENKRKKYSFS